ncbi:hypothetical protein C8R44DRAFT_869805 [Mycena epipterygia]|nr:hypothetical protein C8R44DRAFT_869805 [Mycena epipterygia]
MNTTSESTPVPQWEGITVEDKPTWVLPGPFEIYEDQSWGPPPKTLVERMMYTLSWELRTKPEWQRKAKDPEIRAKWRQEALEQMKSMRTSPTRANKLTEKMIDYVLDELDGYAEIADSERGIERGPFEGIWYSDHLFPEDLNQRLRSAVTILEFVPEADKDWHPGSKGKVLDLVHPSLYPIVYGRTHAYLPGKPCVQSNLRRVDAPSNTGSDSFMHSKAFSWMPSDFAVGEDGSVKLVSPYINNLHSTRHQSLYPIIEEILGGFIPMFERVMGDINKEDGREPFIKSDRLAEISCIWGDQGEPWPDHIPDSDDEGSDGEYQDREEFMSNFFADAEKILPEANEYNGQLQAQFSPVSLRGRNIQCIIKLANIHLTPEDAGYSGGSWHIEGMVNEHIVASGIYYYDEENIDQSNLAFRVATGQPDYHEQDDSRCVEMLFGMVTQEGRALAWSNLFQHSVSPFGLSDHSKPGHRKILAIFLVDPTIDPIVSATDVPPQQAEWASDALEQAHVDPQSNFAKLPQELADLVKGHLTRAYRLRLMKERTVFDRDHTATAFTQTFNMCEH